MNHSVTYLRIRTAVRATLVLALIALPYIVTGGDAYLL